MALVSWCEWSTTREVARTVPCLINQQVAVILATQGQVRRHNYVQFQQGFVFKQKFCFTAEAFIFPVRYFLATE